MQGYGLKSWAACSVSALLLGGSASTFAHQGHDHTGKDQDASERKHQAKASRKSGRARWGADYFPNIGLVTHEGKPVRFFDDLVKDKIVVLYFMYTSCEDSCPVETAQLVRVQRILGERVGKDVFMYSITLDPARDTPEVLKKYAEKFDVGPGWVFLTGKKEEITFLRKKLGLYSEEDGDDIKDHNISMIIGNQRTGRWMKRSPFDNPYFLAAQIGSWLNNWKMPGDVNPNSYAEAPKLRAPSLGENLFRGRCSACHTIGAGDIMKVDRRQVGPDLLGVTHKRDRTWLARWLAEPDQMLAEKDPIALGLYEKYNRMPMPNLRLNQIEVNALIEYMEAESKRVQETAAGGRRPGT